MIDILAHTGEALLAHASFEVLKKSHVGSFMGSAIAGLAAGLWPDKLFEWKIDQNGGTVSAKRLRNLLKRHRHVKNITEFSVEGVFYPGPLLTRGWWERSSRELTQRDDWKDRSLQSWLTKGFEQWAPSWNLNELCSDDEGCFAGQIGSEGGDEADSTVVVVDHGKKARRLRAEMGDKVVSQAIVRGRLLDFSYLIRALEGDIKNHKLKSYLEYLKMLGAAPTHYILVSDKDRNSSVVLDDTAIVEYYSGYLWQCWAPTKWINVKNVAETEITSSYFLWEHTNLADADVVRYSMDSLLRKKDFLENRLKYMEDAGRSWPGKLALLQHGMNELYLTRGSHRSEDPEIKSLDFLHMFEPKKPRPTEDAAPD